MTEPLYQRSRNVLEAELHDEMVALDQVRGLTFGFNRTATWIWKLLEQPQSLAELQTKMLEWFSDVDEATCEADVREILGKLEEAGLVKVVG